MVTKKNFEEYALLYADKELTIAEEKALLDFVALHPELKQELDTYSSIILAPDTSVIFSEKESLLKETPRAGIISFSKYKLFYAAAASIIALLFVLFLNNKTQTKTIAQNTTEKVTPIIKQTSKKSATIEKTTPIKHHQPVQQVLAQKNTSLPLAKESRIANEPIQLGIASNNNYIFLEEFAVATLDVKKLTSATSYKPTTIEETPGYFVDNVAPLFALNETTEGLVGLGKIVTKKIDNVKNAAKQLKGSDVKLKIGNKEILIATL